MRDGVAELGDLVVEPADLGLLELQPAEFLGLLDADLADAVDGLLAVGERPGAERLEGRVGRQHGGVGRGKTPRLPDGRVGFAVARRSPVAHLGEDLLDDAADQVFGHLHGGHRCVVESDGRS